MQENPILGETRACRDVVWGLAFATWVVLGKRVEIFEPWKGGERKLGNLTLSMTIRTYVHKYAVYTSTLQQVSFGGL